MGICNSPDAFQEKISDIFERIDGVRAYIDNVIVIHKYDSEDHLNYLKRVIHKPADIVLMVNS